MPDGSWISAGKYLKDDARSMNVSERLRNLAAGSDLGEMLSRVRDMIAWLLGSDHGGAESEGHGMSPAFRVSRRYEGDRRVVVGGDERLDKEKNGGGCEERSMRSCQESRAWRRQCKRREKRLCHLGFGQAGVLE